MDQAYQLRQIVSALKENRLSSERSKTRIITVTSGKGGVGKTMFTVNLAVSLCEKGFRVLVIDADFGLSNVNIALGIAVKYDLSHVLSKEKTIHEIIEDGPSGVKFISGGNGITELLNLDRKDVEEYIEQLVELDDVADIILIDTGAGISDNILKFVLSSNEVILVTTPEPTALMDAYSLTKTVSKLNKNIYMRLVVNMAQSSGEAEKTLNNFKNLTDIYLDMNVDGLGYLLYDKIVAEAVRRQVPFYTYYPKCDVSKNMQCIISRFLEQPAEKVSQNGLKKFINMFIGRI